MRKQLNKKRHTLGTAYLPHFFAFLACPVLAYHKFNTQILTNDQLNVNVVVFMYMLYTKFGSGQS